MPAGQYDLLDAIIYAYNKGGVGTRLFSLMGPNGCGKSRTLIKLLDHLRNSNIPAVHVPAERSTVLARKTPLASRDGKLETLFGDVMQALVERETPIVSPRSTKVSSENAVFSLIDAAVRHDDSVDQTFKDQLLDWHRGGANPERMPRDQTPLASQITEVIGSVLQCTVDISKNMNNWTLRFKRADEYFGIENLSSGEKQILVACAYLLSDFSNKVVFLVDEPELHLNDALAVSLWERVEIKFPNAIFIYATHSPLFATREIISARIVMDMNGLLQRIPISESVGVETMASIVGSRYYLARSGRPVVFCEDELQKNVLQDVLNDLPVAIEKLSGAKSVIAAVRGTAKWEAWISGGPKVIGVIDLDTRSDREVNALNKSGVLCLSSYDIECAILDPSLIMQLLTRLNCRAVLIDYEEILAEVARSHFDEILQLHIAYIERTVVRSIDIKKDEHGRFLYNDEGVPMFDVRPGNDIDDDVRCISSRMRNSIATRNSRDILSLFRGKTMITEVLRLVSKRHGCSGFPSTSTELYASLREIENSSKDLSGTLWYSPLRSFVQARLSI